MTIAVMLFLLGCAELFLARGSHVQHNGESGWWILNAVISFGLSFAIGVKAL